MSDSEVRTTAREQVPTALPRTLSVRLCSPKRNCCRMDLYYAVPARRKQFPTTVGNLSGCLVVAWILSLVRENILRRFMSVLKNHGTYNGSKRTISPRQRHLEYCE